jgi:multiple sugar transport system substrate-binding protein
LQKLKSRRKKSFVTIIALMLLLSLLTTACGGGSNKNASNTAGNTSADTSQDTGNESAAASGSAESTEKVPEELKGTFTLWTWEPEHPTALAAFHKKYPDIKMTVVNVPAGDVSKKLQTTIASGGELPDVIRIEAGQKAKILSMNVLENLEEAPFNADKSLLFDMDSESFSVDGHMVAIPDDMSLGGLAYLKHLAKQYLGTDDPKELEALLSNWDTFIEKGQEAVRQSGGKVKLFPGLGDVYSVVKGQRSGPYFDGDKLNTQVLTEVLEKLAKFRDSGIVDKLDQWTPAWNAAFGGDKYIFDESPVWMPQYVIGPNDKKEGRWGLMVPPGGGFVHGGSSHGILKGAKNAGLAWKWIETVSLSQEGAVAQKQDGVFTHFKQAYDDKDFTKWTWPSFGDQNIGEKYFVDIAAVTKDIPENLNDLILNDAMNIVLQTMNKDSKFGAAEALANIKKELKAKAPNIVVE